MLTTFFGYPMKKMGNAPIHFHLFFQMCWYFHVIFLSNENKNGHCFTVEKPFHLGIWYKTFLPLLICRLFFYLMHFSIVKVIIISSFNWIKTFSYMSIFHCTYTFYPHIRTKLTKITKFTLNLRQPWWAKNFCYGAGTYEELMSYHTMYLYI